MFSLYAWHNSIGGKPLEVRSYLCQIADHIAAVDVPRLEREAGERKVQILRDVLHQNVRGILIPSGVPVRERQYAIQMLVEVGAAFGILDVDEVDGAERFLKEGA